MRGLTILICALGKCRARRYFDVVDTICQEITMLFVLQNEKGRKGMMA